MGKEESLQLMMLAQWDIHRQKNEVEPLPHTIYQNQLKIDQSPKNKR